MEEISTGMNFESLQKSIEWSYRALEPFRNLNQSLVEEYAGPAYGDNGLGEKFLNKMNQAVDAYTLLLAANRPRVMVSTHQAPLRSFARHFQEAINNHLAEIGLEHTIRQWVMDAFFCIGVVKVHLADSYPVEIENDLWMDPGTPFASNVSLDNFFYDMSARKWTEVKYAGDMYRIPYDDLLAAAEEGIYDPEVVAEMKPTSKFETRHDRLEMFSRGYATDEDEFEPMVDLCDVWIPREAKIYTFPVSRRFEMTIGPKPLAEMDWDADHSCYHILGFNDVPENVMPISPAAHLISLDRLINNIARKSAKQAERQQENPIYTPAGSESAKKLQREGDGMWVEVESIQEVGLFRSGGVDPSNQAYMQNLLQFFDTQAGNLTALLGLGSQSSTVGQEQLIHSAGSRKIGQMQYRVMDATTNLIKSLAMMLWEDEFKEVVGRYEIPGAGGLSVDATWKPGEREGKFMDYNFSISPFSMTYKTPTQTVETINSLVTQIFAPMMPMLMEQGGTIDFAALTDLYADLLDTPRLRDIVKFEGAPSETPAPSMPTKSASTTRNYVRRSEASGQQSPVQENQQWQSAIKDNNNAQGLQVPG